ncbi:hypothetical protein Ancab_016541 [Ancistrocladus abbreviatus]
MESRLEELEIRDALLYAKTMTETVTECVEEDTVIVPVLLWVVLFVGSLEADAVHGGRVVGYWGSLASFCLGWVEVDFLLRSAVSLVRTVAEGGSITRWFLLKWTFGFSSVWAFVPRDSAVAGCCGSTIGPTAVAIFKDGFWLFVWCFL